MDQKPEKSSWAYLNLGLQLAVTVSLFVALGYWLDGRYGWSPWCTLAGGILGSAAGLYFFIRETW